MSASATVVVGTVVVEGDHTPADTITGASPALVTHSVLAGVNDAGTYSNVGTMPEGLRVVVSSPTSAFGELLTADLHPQFQASFTYGVNAEQWLTQVTSGGSVTAASGNVTVAIDATNGAVARLQSRRSLHYRMGQGATCLFTLLASAGAANSYMIAGPISAESGFAFGRNGTAWGTLHRTGGARNIRTLTVTVGAGGAETATVTLEGVTKTVTLASGSATLAAYAIASADYSTTGSGWDAGQVGNTVVFLCRRAVVTSGAFTLTSTGTAAGTIANTRAGAAPTDTWTAQAAWDDPMLLGQGTTGVVLDPTKGNVYRTNYQYLGYGPCYWGVEYLPASGRAATYATVKTLPYLNANTVPSLTNPSAPYTIEVGSTGSTTPISLSAASVMFGTHGIVNAAVPCLALSGSSTNVQTTEIPLISIRNGLTFGGVTNRTAKQLMQVHVSARPATNSILTVRARRGAALTGTPNFQVAQSGVSAAYFDTAASGVSGGTIVWSTTVVADGTQIDDLHEIPSMSLEPGEIITFSVIGTAGTSVAAIVVDSKEFQ